MKTISEYRTETLILLGDPSGKRYSEAILDTGIRQALGTLRKYLPRKETVSAEAAAVNGRDVILDRCPPSDAEILTIRNENGDILRASDHRTETQTCLRFYDPRMIPEPEDTLMLELGFSHTIKGLDERPETTVPEDLFITLCMGAAGYALQIRARSVAEVFGKRPEDTDNLIREGRHLETQFIAALDFAAFEASVHYDPWPGPGFPI